MSWADRSRSVRPVWPAAGGLFLLGAVFWWWQRTGDEVPGESLDARDSVGAIEAPAPIRQYPTPRPRVPASPEASSQPELGAAGVPIMAAHDDSTDHGPRHPHPITPEHERIFRENALIGSLNGALDVRDFEALRRLNERYRTEYPEDTHLLQAGYDLIADCLEQHTPDNRDRAERYFERERASTLRRYVRRYCLQ